jgi:hypothetical protein
VVQKEPAGALNPEIMDSLAAIGIVKGKLFNPDAGMKKILTDAAAIGSATGRTLNWNPRADEEFGYYTGSNWNNPLFVRGYRRPSPPGGSTLTPTGPRLVTNGEKPTFSRVFCSWECPTAHNQSPALTKRGITFSLMDCDIGSEDKE